MTQATLNDFDQRAPGLWNALNRFLIGIIIVLLGLGGSVIFIPILKERREVSARIAQLQDEIAKEKAINIRRSRELELLKNDPEYMELIARDRLDMMKPGETIIRIEPKRPGSGAAAAVVLP